MWFMKCQLDGSYVFIDSEVVMDEIVLKFWQLIDEYGLWFVVIYIGIYGFNNFVIEMIF